MAEQHSCYYWQPPRLLLLVPLFRLASLTFLNHAQLSLPQRFLSLAEGHSIS